MVTVETVARRRPTLAAVMGLGAVLVGAGIGAQRLADNSFLTHLATGRLMLESGPVHDDVFTWTSNGEPVVVQSWLASLLYAVVEEIGGFYALRVLMVVLAGVLAGLVWMLTQRSESLITRALIVTPILFIGLKTWSERPLLIAFVLLAATLLIAEGRGSVRWLAFIGIVWINVHGSWPLGIVLLASRWLGRRLDRRPDRRDREAAVWLGFGVVVGGVVNPYGLALLLFPLELLGRQEILRHVSEWQASSFEATWARGFLVLVAALVVAARRAEWRLIIPSALFVVAALMSARNIPVAALVMIPALAAGLPGIPGLDGDRRSSAIDLATKALLVLIAVFPLVAVRGPHVDLGRYPVAAVNAMEDIGLDPTEVHIVHPDFVGNYLDLRYGDEGATWIDDRFELHSRQLVFDYLELLIGDAHWNDVLERYQPEALLWQSDRVLVELATSVAGWTVVWTDEDWSVLCSPETSACR